jgi:hypothetical protein
MRPGLHALLNETERAVKTILIQNGSCDGVECCRCPAFKYEACTKPSTLSRLDFCEGWLSGASQVAWVMRQTVED